MITHEEVIQISKHYNLNINQSSTIEKYALHQQAKDQAHEELVRDVKRYFELSHNPKTNTNPSEMRPYIEWAEELTDLELHILSKVGKEEWNLK